MTFGKRLRESRKAKSYTQKDLANLIGAKHNSISDWENDKNKPDPDTIELLCGVLDITPNYLLNSNTDDFSPLETEIIKKYRTLDEHSKELILTILNKEYEHMLGKNGTSNTAFSSLKHNNLLNAAHQRTDIDVPENVDTSDDDIMDDDNF